MPRSKILLLALAAGLVIGTGCSSAKRDEAIATDLKAKMFSDPQLKDSSLQVTVTKGEATLTGTVPSDAARYEAFKVATETPGVSKVNDQMTVQTAQVAPAPPAPEPAPQPAPAPKKRAPRRAMTAMNQEAPPVQAPPVDTTPPPAAAPAPAPAPPPPPPPPQPVQVEIPAGTTISIRMIDGVDSSINHTGEQFHASLDAPIVVNDQVVVPKGADISVRLV
jgi:BON domain